MMRMVLSRRIGGGGGRVVEPAVPGKNYTAQWFRPEIDLKELALMRFKKGWILRKLARHFNMPKTKIVKRLKRLDAKKVGA